MPNALQMAGALSEPSNFAPMHTNRIFTGLWTNRSLLRDAATSDYQEHYGMGRTDSILGGQNSEISPRLTLRRRCGNGVYNSNPIAPVNRFYSFNTFTLTNEVIRVMADTGKGGGVVYDATAGALTPVFTKSAGADTTYFLGVGNTLYFTNGADNKQVSYNPTTGTWGTVSNWGIAAPVNAPVVSQAPRPSPPPSRLPNTAYETHNAYRSGMILFDTNGNSQVFNGTGATGAAQPTWNTSTGGSTTDGTVTWINNGNASWLANHAYAVGSIVIAEALPSNVFSTFVVMKAGTSGATKPTWITGVGLEVADGGVIWVNVGPMMIWSSIGPGITITATTQILDGNGNIENVQQSGVTAASGTQPTWGTELGSFTNDGTMAWINAGPWAVASTAPMQYGYAYMNSKTDDLSNMSPASVPISVILGNQVTVQGDGSPDAQVDTIVLYRTAQGGSTFLYLDQIPAPPTGQKWTYIDNTPDSDLNPLIQAQVGGEGTPLPAGATCLAYHLGRIFAAVGNVVYISSGPDAVVSTSSGNAGFDTTFTAQSRITRFWTCSLGLVVFTVRDAYIILGSATSSDPLYMVVFVEQLPLLHYDAFTVNKTTPMMMLGNNMVIALDPSAGIVEVGFPIADRFEMEYDPSKAFVTFHTESSRETALYVANGNGYWYRMNSNNAPESGSAWSTRANIAGMGCVQSVEVTPGTWRLLWTGTATGPIMQRQKNSWTDNGTAFPVATVFGNIVLAQPGQLAALSFITLESARVGTRAGLSLLLGEIFTTPTVNFETLNRTRQDPPDLPPSQTLYSDRYHFAQNQNTAWCRHFQMQLTWPAEDAPNELFTYTLFGQTWQEFRSQ